MTRYLVGKIGAHDAWAAIDPDAICSVPNVAERRFPAFLAPFKNESEARAALEEAGASEIHEGKRK